MTTADPPAPPTPWCTYETAAAAAALGTDPVHGLSTAEAGARFVRIGANALPEGSRMSAAALLGRQFRSLMVLLLVVAALIAALLGDRLESAAIVVVIVLNAAIGFATEWKAGDALAGLRRLSMPTARVRRDGHEQRIAADQLVPGDVILLDAGDRIPADARLAEAERLHVDEAVLTGESMPVQKTCAPMASRTAVPAEQRCMVFAGTVVTDGRGTALVTATGARTETGQIGTLLQQVGTRATPLEAKLTQLGHALLAVVLLLTAAIVLLGWLRGHALLYMLEVGISLAIAAVPEGLLAVTTMTLAIGMQRMARRHALVRRLPAVEALGSTTVICSDKTGTLTHNAMTVCALQLSPAAADRIVVTGTGYTPHGDFQRGNTVLDRADADHASDPLALALRIGALCNDATITRADGSTVLLGDPTESALIVVAEKAGWDHAALERAWPRVAEVPFSSRTHRMITVHRAPDGSTVAYAKGAPAAMLEASAWERYDGQRTSLTPERRDRWMQANEALAADGLRVLALAWRALPDGADHEARRTDEPALARDLTFAGLVGMRDPLREGVVDTMAVCRTAGIRTIMLTGDQLGTATVIARQLGIDVAADGTPLRAVHARDLTGLDDDGWLAVVRNTAVFARVTPEHKLRIVDALQRDGQVVAMTGDGVNDAPALKAADIGIAMGIRGTEVAKDAADMVLTDDDFTTIVHAIEQGRVIVDNILRFIHYLFSCNIAEIFTVFAAILLGWPLPLGVLQILWLNLVTDIFPAMALALEPSAPAVMQRPPRAPDAPLLTRRFAWRIAWEGGLIAACTLVAFRLGWQRYGTTTEGLPHAVTMAFMTLALAQLVHAFSARSQQRSAFAAPRFANRWLWGALLASAALQIVTVSWTPLRAVLRTTTLSGTDWLVVVTAALSPLLVVEIVKAVQRVRSRA